MRFAFAVRKLDGQLNEAIEQIGQCQRLYQKDGIHEPALAASLQATRESLESLRRSLSGIVAANERKFDMIAYLTEALKMEHGTVSELQSCLRVMPESPVRETLHRMLLEEKQHEEALVKRIVDLGGEPRVDLEIPPRPTSLSIADLLDQRLELLLTNAILRSVLELVYSLCDDRVVRPPYVNLHILGPCDIYAYSVN